MNKHFDKQNQITHITYSHNIVLQESKRINFRDKNYFAEKVRSMWLFVHGCCIADTRIINRKQFFQRIVTVMLAVFQIHNHENLNHINCHIKHVNINDQDNFFWISYQHNSCVIKRKFTFRSIRKNNNCQWYYKEHIRNWQYIIRWWICTDILIHI